MPVAQAGGGIEFDHVGASFAPNIALASGASCLWTTSDGQTSTSTTPSFAFSGSGLRTTTLQVTPWNGLLGVTVGYDAADGGSPSLPAVTQQNVVGVRNLGIAASSLLYFCCSYNPITSLDFAGFSALNTLEAFHCDQMSTINLAGCTALRRLCLEHSNTNSPKLTSLDLSACSLLEDYRGACQDLRTLVIPPGGLPHLWHWCVWGQAHAPQWPLNQFGAEIATDRAMQYWFSNTNQSGIPQIPSAAALTRTNFVWIAPENNGYSQAGVDAWLVGLDASGQTHGILAMTGTAVPSATGLAAAASLTAKGWDIRVDT